MFVETLFHEGMLYAMNGDDPSKAIDDMHKKDQRMMLNKSRLPILANFSEPPDEIKFQYIKDDMSYDERKALMDANIQRWTKEQYEKMGIQVLDASDDLMVEVILPEGWKNVATDHSMWNEIRDEKNRKRITYFYKGSPWDRDAFSCFERRYSFRILPFDNYEGKATYEDRKFRPWSLYITDCGERIIKLSEIIPATDKEYYESDDKLRPTGVAYLNEHYPDWKDIHAYWNDTEVNENAENS